ncbi:hypothetical protein [Faecalicatena contorta]|nr:hypothetical protein [Faecalicatena contorta]
MEIPRTWRHADGPSAELQNQVSTGTSRYLYLVGGAGAKLWNKIQE